MLKKDAIKLAGSIRALSMMLGVARSTVQDYSDTLPAWRAAQIMDMYPDKFKVKNVKRESKGKPQKVESAKAASKKTVRVRNVV